MTLLPKSRKARRRLAAVAIAAPILAAAAGLAFYALGDAVFLLLFAQPGARAAGVPAGRTIELGGLVAQGSVRKTADGGMVFVVADHRDRDAVIYRGEVPDLFREGQGVVAKGAFLPNGVFQATEILAKHDERYMPRELVKALKASGEWRGDQRTAAQ